MADNSVQINDENVSSENICKAKVLKKTEPSQIAKDKIVKEKDFNIVFFTGKSTEPRPDDKSLRIKLPKALCARLQNVNKELDTAKYTNSAVLFTKEIMADKARTIRMLGILSSRKKHHDKVYLRMMEKAKEQRYDMSLYSALPPRLFKRLQVVEKSRRDATLLREEFSSNWSRCRSQLLGITVKHKSVLAKLTSRIAEEYKKNFEMEPNCTKEMPKLPERLARRHNQLRQKYFKQKHSARHSNAERRRNAQLLLRKIAPRLRRQTTC